MNFFNKCKDNRGLYTIFESSYRKQNVHNLSLWWAGFWVFMVFSLCWYSKYRLLSLPTALTVNELPTHYDSFIAERAWHDLNILNNFGPRPTGNYANEVLAVDFLKREISFIQQAASKNQKIYVDVQKTSGAYWAAFKPHGMTNVYRNVQNVIVQLAGSDGAANSYDRNHTLMLNCHFDSVAGSPGASDDAASCCVMLEILRVLSQQEKRTRHNVLFLFNGAEETPLQAAHGFITQHPWAENVRAFLNLESVGSNGKEILFQSGPNHAWLIEMYRKSIPHPNGHTAAEELFHSGVIPSDTDFRIFRDFGHVPGMDFAHVFNGYRYHTKYDHIDYIPPAVLQRTGDNILALVKIIANSDELTNTKAYETGRMVFYDLLGFAFVAYSETTGQVLSLAIGLISIIVSFYSLRARGINQRIIRKEIFYGLIITIIGFVLGLGVCYVIATELDWSGKSMAWYQHTLFSVTLYCVPALAIHSIFYSQLTRSRESALSLGLKVQARINGVNLLWASITIVLSLVGYRSAYVFMVPVLITLISSATTIILKAQNSNRKWLQIHLVGQAFVILWTSNIYHLVIGMFIPIAGRSGGGHNPDVTIAVLCCFFTLFITSYLIPLVGLLHRPKIFLFGLVAVYILTRLSFVTHVEFPYRDDSDHNPTPQRHFITHTARTLYDYNGRVSYTDSGYWFREVDRNSEKTIDSLTAPETPIRHEENAICKAAPFCGLPFYTCRQLHTGGFWLDGPAPLIREEAELTLLSKTNVGNYTRKLNFTVKGSYLFSIQIYPRAGISLTNWDITQTVPEPNIYNDQKGYFVMVTHGLEAPPMNFTLEFKVEDPNFDGPLTDLTVVTFHWEYHRQHTPAFTHLLSRVPNWAFVVPSVASLKSWIF